MLALLAINFNLNLPIKDQRTFTNYLPKKIFDKKGNCLYNNFYIAMQLSGNNKQETRSKYEVTDGKDSEQFRRWVSWFPKGQTCN